MKDRHDSTDARIAQQGGRQALGRRLESNRFHSVPCANEGAPLPKPFKVSSRRGCVRVEVGHRVCESTQFGEYHYFIHGDLTKSRHLAGAYKGTCKVHKSADVHSTAWIFSFQAYRGRFLPSPNHQSSHFRKPRVPSAASCCYPSPATSHRCSVVIARHALALVDALILDRRLEHHAIGQFIDHASLDFLPRGLAGGAFEAT